MVWEMSNRKMGRKGPIKNQNMQFIESVATQVKEEDKKEIQLILGFISTIKDKEHYQSAKMRDLFGYWHKYMPRNKQSIDCGACRQAVLQFWQKVNEKWIDG